MNFIDRKISGGKAIALLARKDIDVSDEEAEEILNFLYLMAKIQNKKKVLRDAEILKEKSN
jgi:hypothetical protein